MPLRVADLAAALEREYPPEWAADWDSVGLVVGDPGAEVRCVLLAVDPVPVVVEQARAVGAQLIVTHHPLLLGGVTSVARSDPKGAIVHDLIAHGTALFVAHTNADVAPGGVNDALAAALGLQCTRPLLAPARAVTDQLTVFVPVAAAADLVDALADSGAGRTGDYDRATWSGMAFTAFVTDVYSGGSWGGAQRRRCRPACRWTLWRWRCGPAPALGSPLTGWCTIPIMPSSALCRGSSGSLGLAGLPD